MAEAESDSTFTASGGTSSTATTTSTHETESDVAVNTSRKRGACNDRATTALPSASSKIKDYFTCLKNDDGESTNIFKCDLCMRKLKASGKLRKLTTVI